jgi:hypothetical protein
MHHITIGDVPAAAKGHVFEEMGQPLFLVPLDNRARSDPHAHGHAIAGRLIMHDRVTQPIGQRAEHNRAIGLAPGVILRPAPRLLWRRAIGQHRRCDESQRQKADGCAEFHCNTPWTCKTETST